MIPLDLLAFCSCPVFQPHGPLQNQQTLAWTSTLAVVSLEHSSPVTLSATLALFLFANHYQEPFLPDHFI